MLLSFTAALGGSQCQNGTFDGGIVEDAGQGVLITAADIGTLCTYVDGSGENPSNTCGKIGLECLIRTFDGLYGPYAPGTPGNLTNAVWEDQTTVYRPTPTADGKYIDEGYCTLLGTWQVPPACPAGTELKLFSGNLAACMRTCTASGECARSGYVCDRRYLDTANATCVRSCEFDVPDCIRSGILVTQATQTQEQKQFGAYLAFQDLGGASYCDVSSGLCAVNASVGTVPPGSPCNDTRDCVDDQICLQNNVLGTPQGQTGVCGLACKPNPMAPLEGCPAGYACQAGFQFGHAPFAVKDIVTGDDLEAGGVCLPECASSATACTSYPGTACASADEAVFGQPWNQVSMCLLPELAN